MDRKLMVLGDEELFAVSGGHKGKGYYRKHVEQSLDQNQNQSVDVGGDVILKGNASLTITFGDQSQTASQTA
ncbi:hypothetical protein [Anaeromyxobacter terrae]|uniref:hypothetical protein n=1 Tax=Anaeromyxobacter terrae TaxID=2925406 RepID=UPI001F57259B|nr:hypothetical protein [Anaeromyxobacter sp. SG22]